MVRHFHAVIFSAPSLHALTDFLNFIWKTTLLPSDSSKSSQVVFMEDMRHFWMFSTSADVDDLWFLTEN